MPIFRQVTARLSQAEKLLSILSDHDWHVTKELVRRVGHRFGNAIYQLRQNGYIIERQQPPTKNYQHQYRLRSDE